MKTRPNILFIMSDEHRSDILGCVGNSIIRTPNIDKLAQDGLQFNNAYCPSPICIPCRQSIAAGQFPRHCGVERFGEDLAPGYLTFARQFSRYGYETVAAGKLHHTGPDQMQGYKTRIGMESCISDQYIENKREEFFGLGQISLFKWNQDKEIKRAGIGYKGSREDEYSLQGTLLYLENYFVDAYYDRPQGHKPLMIYVGFNQPHYPYLTSEEKFNYYLNRVKQYENQEVFEHPFLNRFVIDATEREKQRAIAAYYGMIETVDDYIGVLLNKLEEVGQDIEDWIIVYTSDHGEMLGEHGVWEKQKFFEGSVKVPLIIRCGKNMQSGRVIKENVNLCDLYATLCEICGIDIPEGLDSRSLVPLMNGDSTNWYNESISQYYGENLMIKWQHLKYHYYKMDDSEILFDLERDPSENKNFITDVKYKEVINKFRNRKEELKF